MRFKDRIGKNVYDDDEDEDEDDDYDDDDDDDDDDDEDDDYDYDKLLVMIATWMNVMPVEGTCNNFKGTQDRCDAHQYDEDRCDAHQYDDLKTDAMLISMMISSGHEALKVIHSCVHLMELGIDPTYRFFICILSK